MDFIWSPWRYGYVSSATGPASCVFCVGPEPDRDAERLILYRGEHNFVIMNLFPYTSGHLMVAPYAHLAELPLTSPAESTEMMALATRAVAILGEAYRPDGFNLGMNLGQAAGAGIRDHLHLHVVPRWQGDSNFMTVTGETRVLPEDLQSAYGRLRPMFDRLPPAGA